MSTEPATPQFAKPSEQQWSPEGTLLIQLMIASRNSVYTRNGSLVGGAGGGDGLGGGGKGGEGSDSGGGGGEGGGGCISIQMVPPWYPQRSGHQKP